jgi:hypothetical protein
MADYAAIYAKTYKPGDEVEASGVYRVTYDKNHVSEHEVTVVHGKKFPPCMRYASSVQSGEARPTHREERALQVAVRTAHREVRLPTIVHLKGHGLDGLFVTCANAACAQVLQRSVKEAHKRDRRPRTA